MPRWLTDLLTILLLLAIAGGLAFLFIDHTTDQPYIAYRYAQNLAAGEAFSYNPGERLLAGQVSPLYIVLLALGTRLIPTDLPTLGHMISAIAIGIGAAALYGAARSTPLGEDETRPPWFIAFVTALLYLVFPLLWLNTGLDAALWIALCLLAVWSHLQEIPMLTAILLALATLLRLETLALAGMVAASAIITGRKVHFLAAGLFVAIALAGLAWFASLVDGGSILPGLPGVGSQPILPGYIGKTLITAIPVLPGALIHLSPVWIGVLLLAGFGLIDLRRHHFALLLVGWTALHAITLLSFGAAIYAGQIAPLVPALAALVGVCIGWLARLKASQGVHTTLAGIALLILVGAAGESLLRMALSPQAEAAGWKALSPPPVSVESTQAASWLIANTPGDALVGAAQFGVLGYQSGRPILDYNGMLQAGVSEAIQRGDVTWWLHTYLPDFLVLRESEAADMLNGSDPWAAAAYQEAARFGDADPLVIYRRGADYPPLQEHLVGMIAFPDGLVLNSIAADIAFSPLDSGRVARFRLEWLLNEPLAAPRYVAVQLLGRNGSLVALDGSAVAFDQWPVRELHTTYHTIEIAPNPLPGIYDLFIGVGPSPDALTWQAVTHAKVPLPETEFLGALTGTRTVFGSIALLGYRLNRTPDTGLEVLLMWEALEGPQADYRVFIQLRDLNNAIVAQQVVEPHQGAYPTSFWEAGEQIADTYTLAADDILPGEYTVYAGLLDPDGNRLLTLEGLDSVLIGRINIQQP